MEGKYKKGNISNSTSTSTTNNTDVHAVALCQLKRRSISEQTSFTAKWNNGFNGTIDVGLSTPSNTSSNAKSNIITNTVTTISPDKLNGK